MSSIKKNFFYSTFLTISNYVFPLITYPYVSRILQVEKIGLCNFIDSVINYFMLFSMLGISTYGIREIAKNKNNTEKINHTFYDLISVNIFMSIIAIIILLISLNFSNVLNENKDLVYVGICKLLLNIFLVEWFYKGIEDFKYITIRSFIVKCIYVISIFLFVKTQSDYVIYYIITVGMFVLNAFCNIIHIHKYISIKYIRFNLSHYFKPLCIFGLYSILTSMYTSFNVMYLGVVSSPTEVGYYTTATKLYGIFIGIFTAFTGVMLPRMSAIVSENNTKEFNRLLLKSYDALLGFSLPITFIGILCAPEIILFIAGNGFEGAITPMRIVMPLVFIIGYEQVIIMQILMPLKKDNAILINSVCGAVVGILLNILLVNRLKAVGSAFVWVCSEMTVLLIAQYFVSKYTNHRFPLKKIITYLLYTIPVVGIYWLVNYFFNELYFFIRLLISCISISLYCITIYAIKLKNSIVLMCLCKISKVIGLHKTLD